MNVLVVAAHPDDEILGVGGTIIKHVCKNDRVKLVVLCEGISVRYNSERHAEVAEQAQRAATILGVSDLALGQLPEQKLDTLPISKVAGEVEKVIGDWNPELIYTHFSGDMNRDHRVVAEAVLIAARPYAAPNVKEILMFETPSSTEWSSPHLPPVFQPSAFVDITSALDRKIEAFLQYSAEVCEYPHPRSAEALRARANYWGSLVNRHAAEPFAVVRSLR